MNESEISELNLIHIPLSDLELTSDSLNRIITQLQNTWGRERRTSLVELWVSGSLQFGESTVTARIDIMGANVGYELQSSMDGPWSNLTQRYSDTQMGVYHSPQMFPLYPPAAYCGPRGLCFQIGPIAISTSPVRREVEPLQVRPKILPTPAMEIPLTIKAFRRMLNGVAKASNGVFTLASHRGKWNVFSGSPTVAGTRWRVTPNIYSSAIGGVEYKTMYDFFFRKKRAVRGVFSQMDEDTEITLCLRDNGEVAVSLQLTSLTKEIFIFEPDVSTLGLLDLLEDPGFELPFKGRAVEQVTIVAEESTTTVAEDLTEEVEALAQEPASFSVEEEDRMDEWRAASMRHQLGVGAPISESPQIWFSHYMMERLRQGEAIDDLDNQILAKL